MPVKPMSPTTPIKYYGAKNNLVALLPTQPKGSHRPGRPGLGQVPPLKSQFPNVPSMTGVTGWAVNNIGGTIYGMYTGVSGLVGEGVSAVGDAASAIASIF